MDLTANLNFMNRTSTGARYADLFTFLSSGKFDYFKEQDKLHRVYDIAVSDKKYIVSSSINSWYEDFVSWAIDKKPGKCIQKSKHMTYWKLDNDSSNQRTWNFPNNTHYVRSCYAFRRVNCCFLRKTKNWWLVCLSNYAIVLINLWQ